LVDEQLCLARQMALPQLHPPTHCVPWHHTQAGHSLRAPRSALNNNTSQLTAVQRLELMDGATENGEAEVRELARLELQLEALAARHGVSLPPSQQQQRHSRSSSKKAARSKASDAAGAQQPPDSSMGQNKQQQQQQAALRQLVRQQTEFLSVLQGLLTHNTQQPGVRSNRQGAVAAVIAASSAAAAPPAAPAAAPPGVEEQLAVLRSQLEQQVADNTSLKKRYLKVQRTVLRHLQDARLQVAAADAARDEALR
jgi:hypothetical protein